MNLSFDDIPEMEDVQQRLNDADPEVRRIAVMDLVEIYEDGCIQLAIKALSDPDAGVRKQAAQALEEFEGEEVITAMLDAPHRSRTAWRACSPAGTC